MVLAVCLYGMHIRVHLDGLSVSYLIVKIFAKKSRNQFGIRLEHVGFINSVVSDSFPLKILRWDN